MTEQKLITIVNKIVEETKLADDELVKSLDLSTKQKLIKHNKEFTTSVSLSCLEIISNYNKELTGSINDKQIYKEGYVGKVGMMVRIKPFTGNELIKGDYLLYDLTGHSGECRLTAFESLSELEEMVKCDGGYRNMFTTDMVPIIFGKVKHFDLYYLKDGVDHRFVKKTDEWDCTKEEDVRIVWLD